MQAGANAPTFDKVGRLPIEVNHVYMARHTHRRLPFKQLSQKMEESSLASRQFDVQWTTG